MYGKIIANISNLLYTYVLPYLLVGAGLYFTFRTKGVQFGLLGESIHVVSEPSQNKKSLSSFQALMVSTASRVGTGNIVGVSTALCLGGAGSIFWMWVVALVGAASAFVESTLAQIYKKSDGQGGSYGGPAYYIEQGLKSKGLGMLFAITLILTYAGGFNMLAAFNVSSSFNGFSFFNANTTPAVIGIVLGVLMALSIFGGGKKLSNITAVLVPVMSIIYIVISFVMIFKNINLVPKMFADIFRSAFDFRAIFGGFTGSAMMLGMKRGLYSNEAGIGSAPNAAASASVSHPVKQGLVQVLSVYIDTIIICTATAFMLLCSGVAPSAKMAGAPYNISALTKNFGSFGMVFFTFALFLFAFTTLIGNYFYAEANLAYIFRKKLSHSFVMVFRTICCILVFIGTQMKFSVAWDTADVLMALMALINLPTIITLSKPAFDCLKDYTAQKKEGKNPVFLARNIGLKEHTDFWN